MVDVGSGIESTTGKIHLAASDFTHYLLSEDVNKNNC